MLEFRPENDEHSAYSVPAQLPPEVLKLIIETKLELDKRMVQARIEDMRRQFLDSLVGQFCAFAIASTTLFAIVYLAMHDKTVPASCLGLSGLAAVVGKFIQGRQLSRGAENRSATNESKSV